MRPAICSIVIFEARSFALSSTGKRQSSYLSSLPFLFRSLKERPSTVSILTPDWPQYPSVGPLGFFTRINPGSCCADWFFKLAGLLLVNTIQQLPIKTILINNIVFLLFFILLALPGCYIIRLLRL